MLNVQRAGLLLGDVVPRETAVSEQLYCCDEINLRERSVLKIKFQVEVGT